MAGVKKKRFVPKTLYLGTNENLGKEYIKAGIKSPVILSDVYSPFFASQKYQENSNYNWCVIEINTGNLDTKGFYPFHGYLERWSRNRLGIKDPEGIATLRQKYLKDISITKIKWHQSFDTCGTILYNLTISAKFIKKVVFFDPKSNLEVVELVNSFLGPWETTGPYHRQNWGVNKLITDWMLCNLCSNYKDWMVKNTGLEIFYLKSENK